MNMLGEEPPYLSVGTEVSAKYKGAFCEAKVRKVDRVVKCKVAFKQGFGSHTVLDNQIKGQLRLGAIVEARHPDKKEIVEGTITKIQDCSQYTVVFDDGDITTLRRSALCLKSGRHFAESETLDQLPLTHPEHFGNPVVGGRRGGRRRLGSDESSGEEESQRKGKPRDEIEAEIGKIVCVELGDKKKGKDNWFPGLVVSPSAQETVRIRVKEEYLVRSFKDARYYTVPKKETTEFTREVGLRVENSTLKSAVEKALTFLDKNELPPHWDREQLFSQYSDDSDSEGGLDSDSSDDEPREEKDHFVAQLYKFMDDRGTPINVCPSVCSKDLDLCKLYKLVRNLNGYNRVNNNNQWKVVSTKLGFGNSPNVVTQVKHAYKKFLHSFEEFNRKLGCTMVNHPRGSRSRSKGGRSLIREADRATPVKMEPSSSSSSSGVKRIDEPAPEEVPVKRIEEVKPKIKEGEPDTEMPSDTEPSRSGPSSRKKFPTLKASPRTKEDSPVLKRRAENRPIGTRPKRALRENSIEDATSGDESVKTVQGSEEQRSSSRVRSREESKLSKKEGKTGKLSSKSSDSDGSKKKESDDAKKPMGECLKGKRPPDEANGKRNRKVSKTTEKSNMDTRSKPCIPRNRCVLKGDVVKVYYGSPSENVIYEAKVVEMEDNEMFLVHYSGWNSRYDEWVPRSKIAENVSWSDRRTKTPGNKDVKGPPTSGSGNKKKGPPGNKSEPIRSTTPSSITSSSSRTKSPATPVTTRRRASRRERPAVASTRRRTRRLSGHTEFSVDSGSESDSESVESESDSETQALVTKKPIKRSRPRRKLHADPSSDKKPRLARNSGKGDKEIDDFPASPSTSSSKNSDTVKSNDGNEESLGKGGDDGDSPKGRDFDLNEIRSELKGIDKAIKVPTDESDPASKSETVDGDDENDPIEPVAVKIEDDEDKPLSVKKQLDEASSETKPKTLDDVEVSAKESKEECLTGESEKTTPTANKGQLIDADIKEDIYEFKEPEPFEFQEVRRTIRNFDESFERSPEKTSPAKNIPPVSTTPVRGAVEKKEPSPQDDVKSRFRKTICKKIKESEKRKTIESKTEDMVAGPPVLNVTDENPLPPQLEVNTPQLLPDVIKSDNDDEPPVISPIHKASPEPPCLLPVTESIACPPPEHSPVLIREEPPRLSTEASSSDSECEERLVIANDEESTSSDVKQDAFFPSGRERSASPPPPPMPVLEDRREAKRSPLSEIRLKRLEDRMRGFSTNSSNQEEPPKEVNTFRPIASTSKVTIGQQPAAALEPDSFQVIETEAAPVAVVPTSTASAAAAAAPSGSSGSGLRSLVCDEDIPGSPAPKDPSDDLPFQAPSASVMENTPPTTPPTTPESNASSPREDRVARLYQSIELSSMDNESSKSHRDSSEIDLDNDGHRNRGLKFEKRNDEELLESPSKKKRNRKRSESNSETSKRGPNRTAAASPRVRRDHHGSDSDDTSENSTGLHLLDPSMSNRSPRPMKNAYWKETVPDLDANQKIAYLQHRLLELKKSYAVCKSELASIERKRKKARRKEREEKQAAAAAAALAAAPPSVVAITKPQETI